MPWLLGFIGAILGIGAGATGSSMLGFVGGAALGALIGSWISLRQRVDSLQQHLQRLEAVGMMSRPPPPTATVPAAATPQVAATPVQATTTQSIDTVSTSTHDEAVSSMASDSTPSHARVTPVNAAVYASREPNAVDPLVQSLRTQEANAAAGADALAAAAIAAELSAAPAAVAMSASSSTPADSAAAAAQTAKSTPQHTPPRPAARVGSSDINGRDGSSSSFWRWFGEGNWVLKIGLGLVFVGIGAFFKYAAAQGWLRFPIEYRFISVALLALIALGFGWMQRRKRPLFALNLQGGAIGILILTVFSAYRLYHLLPSSITFGLLLALVAGCAVLAILQDSLGLAVFGIIGGFAAPILASTGSGDHVALFSYYALLNLGIVTISWSKGWRVLNVLGFLFTFVIGTLWGVLSYRAELFNTTEPFLILFFAMYLLIPLLPALRNPDPLKRDRVDGSLVFGTPLIGFGLQAALLQHDRFALAWSAIGLAVIYAILARVVWQSAGLARWRKAYAGLSLVFATLAVPLALSAQWTSTVWAVEGALLVWLGLDQNQRRLRWSGLLLQLLAGIALLFAVGDHWPEHSNHRFAFGAVLVTLSGLFSAIQYRRRGASQSLTWMLAGWSFMWWYLAGLLEIDRHAPAGREADIALVFIAVTGLAGAFLRRAFAFRPFGWPAHFALLMALPFVTLMTLAHMTPLADRGWAFWLVYFVAAVPTLWLLDRGSSPGVKWSHAIWWLSLPVIAWIEIDDWLDAQQMLGEGWRVAAMSLPILIPLGLLWKRVALAGYPVRDGVESLRTLLLPLFAIAAVMLSIVILMLPGSSAPLPWLPILNPLELTQIAALMMVMRYVAERGDADNADGGLRALMMAFGFVAISAATLRLTHHYGGEPWDVGMFTRALPQSALSIVWTLMGIVAMVIGARRARRTTWIAGASVLGLVLAKLLVIDMRFLGDLWGIVSLLGVGMLFVAVGFFAPMPPRDVSGERA